MADSPSPSSLTETIFAFPARRPVVTLVVGALLLAVGAIGLARIRINTSLQTMFPENKPSAAAMVRVLDHFPATSELIVLASVPQETPGPQPQQLQRFAERLEQLLKTSPDAKKLLLTMADRDPNDPAVLERLAEAQFGAGKIDAARQSAAAALKIDPQRLGAKRTMAKIAMQERDYATALPYLQELAVRNPQDVTMSVELATALAQTGAAAEAWQKLAPALAQGYPDEKGSLHYLLGTVLRKMGRAAEAEQAFAAAKQLSEAFQQKSYRDQDPDAQPQ